MRIQKLESTDGFLLFDIEGAEKAAGVARLAPKVLHDSAELLARTVTYSCAAFGLKVSGASAGINAKPEGRDAAIAAFIEEVKPLVASGALSLQSSTGLSDADLAPLGTDPPDPLADLVRSPPPRRRSAGRSREDRRGHRRGTRRRHGKRRRLTDRGVTLSTTAVVDAMVDVLVRRGRRAASSTTTPPRRAGACRRASLVTTGDGRAYAALRQAEIVYVPDFVALAAPLLAPLGPDSPAEPVERVRESGGALADDGPKRGSPSPAWHEGFLATWQDPPPGPSRPRPGQIRRDPERCVSSGAARRTLLLGNCVARVRQALSATSGAEELESKSA